MDYIHYSLNMLIVIVIVMVNVKICMWVAIGNKQRYLKRYVHDSLVPLLKSDSAICNLR